MNVEIIYNPNSTGDSEKNAKELAEQLRTLKIPVTTQETTHAGHGEEIAKDLAEQDAKTILISSSGDGGYNEVVNGALQHDTSNFVVGVLPSGNANDHYTALGGDSLAESIANKSFQHIDTIKVSATVDGASWVRYAHSYVGIGVTATAAKSLTEDRPNAVTEKRIVARSLFSFSYIKLKVQGDTRRYSSLLFANIGTMSKIMKLSQDSSVTDGKFEMSTIRFRSKFRLVAYLLTAATVGLSKAKPTERFECTAIEKLPIQLDGEVFVIDAGSAVSIESVKQNLRCVL